jgi:tRNA(Arg) A34 adenosine deaminase TadA
VLEAENTVVTGRDITGHAELNLIREASARFEPGFLAGCTMYASTAPCAMCAGAVYWSGVRRVVFGLGKERFARLVGEGSPADPLAELDVSGPYLEDEALAVHEGFWS